MGFDGVGWLAAIIIGGIAGWLAGRFMNTSQGVLMNIILGIVRRLDRLPDRRLYRCLHPYRHRARGDGP
jgi:hypothetical protein